MSTFVARNVPLRCLFQGRPYEYRKAFGFLTTRLLHDNAYAKKYPELHELDFLEDGTPDYLKLILRSRVYDVVDEAGSPLTYATNLSHKLNTNVHLKREDLLPVFSFKLRGAYNMISNIHASSNVPINGVIACSAGNHAQGVAYSAHKLHIPATIVMPIGTPSIKYANVSRLGSQVVLFGEDFDAAKKECERLTSLNGLTNIPPFDHPYVIAGQGTIALEITRQLSLDTLNAIFVPVGGGGLIAGIGAYLKKIAPHVKIIGVETYDADALYKSLKANNKERLALVGVFADGTAVKVLGDETWKLCHEFVDEVVRVSTDELCAAIKDVFEDTRSILEPSGALSVAGLKKYIAENSEVNHKLKTYVPILSGANMNFDRLRFVSERAVLGEGKEISLVITIPERPGEFKRLQDIIDPRSITEFCYRYSNDGGPANVLVSFSVNQKAKELNSLTTTMTSDKYGYNVIDVSDNELAKSHGRYLIGGKCSSSDEKVSNERLYAFEFPERPGALTKFLKQLKDDWNITLFHYRNHGHDVGKVLCGFSVPGDVTDGEFNLFLEELGYKFVDETNNIIYAKFLRS